jgi:toxin-antitoxin system PIN domain toxin
MILVDANLLVYAWNVDSPHHEPARRWLQDRLSGMTGVGLPWASLLAFIRLVSNPRVFERAASVSQAWGQVAEWLLLEPVFVPEPAHRYREILGSLMPETGSSQMVPDAHLAALAIEYGLTLQTTDRGFARFSGLKWENPLAA